MCTRLHTTTDDRRSAPHEQVRDKTPSLRNTGQFKQAAPEHAVRVNGEPAEQDRQRGAGDRSKTENLGADPPALAQVRMKMPFRFISSDCGFGETRKPSLRAILPSLMRR